MSVVGLRHNLLDDEAEAYLAGYLAGELTSLAYEELDNDLLEHRYMKNFCL
jgi:hypothetical protein